MKILHVTEAYGGGVSTAIKEYVNDSPEHLHYLAFRPRPGHNADVLNESPFVRTWSTPSVSQLAVRFRSICEEADPDLIHLHSSWAGVIGRTLGKGRAARLAYTPHCYFFERTNINAAVRQAAVWVERSLAVQVDLTICVSPREAQLTSDLGGRAVYVPNKVDIDHGPERGAIMDPAPGHDATRTVLGIGRLEAQKDPIMFAEVAEALADLHPAVRFVWVGDGEEKFRTELTRRGVEITGWLSRAGVLQVLGDSDVYLHTAAWEGSPMTVLEAEALGVATIVRSTAATVSLGYPGGSATAAQLASRVRKFLECGSYDPVRSVGGVALTISEAYSMLQSKALQ